MSIPKRAAQLITVSGPVDAAVATVVAAFGRRHFRVRRASPTVTELQIGHRNLPMLLGEFSLFPGALGRLGKYMRLTVELRGPGEVLVGVEEMQFGITLYPVVLEALEELLETLEANGVLEDVGPLADLDDLRSIHPS